MLSDIENIGSRGFEDYLMKINREIFAYGNATHAYVDILLHLKKKNPSDKPNIILPSFIPAKLHRVTLAAGYLPLFYEIDTCCNFNPFEVEKLIDKDTRCIFVVHYFGRPADILPLRRIADKNNISLIEDCAHVLFGELNRKPLGTFGDFRIFSIRKMLVLSDGGYLGISDSVSDFKPSYNRRVRSIYTFSKFLPSRIKSLYFKLTGGSDIFRLAKAPKKGFIDFNRESRLKIMKISRLSSFISRTTDIKKQVEVRRENYIYLINALKEFSFIKPLFEDLPALWTPYSLPALVLNGDRDLLQTELLKFGISCGSGWPESPFDCHLQKTKTLSQNIIEFPVHPLITKEQLKYIIAGCSSFEKKLLQASPAFHQVDVKTTDLKFSLPSNENSLSNDDPGISIKIIGDTGTLTPLRDQWNWLCENADAHIFQTFDWQYIWWKHYGKGKKLHIILFYHNSSLIGIAPLFIDTFKIEGLTILRRLRLIGSSVDDDASGKFISSYSASDYLDVIIHKNYKNTVAEKLVEHLYNNYSFYDSIQFDEISNDSDVFRYIIPRLNELNWEYKATKGEICPRIIIPNSISDFMKSLSSKIRYQLSKIRRDINNRSLFKLKKANSLSELEKEFNEFVRLHQQRWNSQGLPGAFIDSRFKLFLKEVTAAFLQSGWLHLTSVYSENNCLAVECAFKYKSYFYDYLKAFDDQSPLSKYRPGRALLLLLIEEAVNNKFNVVDLLRGGEPYKFEIATEWHWIYKVTINNPTYSFNIRYAVYIFILASSQVRHHIIKEARIMKAQLKNFGINGLTAHYIPMTLRKIRYKLSHTQPIKELRIAGSRNQNGLNTHGNIVETALNNFSNISEKR